RQYMRILEREMSVRSENEAINNINHLMEKDKVIENVLGQFIVGNSIKIYSNKKIEAKEPSANNFDDYSFENNNNLRSYSKKEAVNASFVLS
ncbi:MAG: hypothetical protein ABF741_11045, partial [Liquorilactobacillus ghanensis]|uniref:hypothetical protein n=1 Tax=Liquorilactobacillus ghanensis TaxID=399370 RepID=UPI0039EC5595